MPADEDDGFEGLRAVEDADGLAVTVYTDQIGKKKPIEPEPPKETWRDRPSQL